VTLGRRRMSNAPVRRAQLIAPFGVGALMVAPEGTSLITAGLDHWYQREDTVGDTRDIDQQEFHVEEWRLQRVLGVTHFRLPPDYRVWRFSDPPPNVFLTVPTLRFPRWHFCPGCHRLNEFPLTIRGRIRCAGEGCRRFLVQVPFVAMCDYGHIQDFPWREWVHRSRNPPCQEQLYLYATGGATLAAQKVKCDCGTERNLAGITTAHADRGTTELTASLIGAGDPFLCQGLTPWLGTDDGLGCSQPLRGSLRSASNLYFSLVRSAIYLPRSTDSVPPDLLRRLENPPLSTLIRIYADTAGQSPSVEVLREQHFALLRDFSDAEVEAGVRTVMGEDDGGHDDGSDAPAHDEGDLRGPEFASLRRRLDHPDLTIRPARLDEYEDWLARHFARVMLVDRLRETRAFTGFNRIFPENEYGLADRKRLLRRIEGSSDRWLPAYIVYGEGLFFELSPEMLERWEARDAVQERIEQLAGRLARVTADRRLRPREITPRFVLVHTLAHLLINRLTYECGYSSAALRERLYVSEPDQPPMAGVLIYTAAGDAEGTMGGLVRMGKPGRLEHTLGAALAEAAWCSADPVCMELGERAGQGPDSCNVAACHNCALVPETACEEFNRFLDRGVVVGTAVNPSVGYFERGALT
jgi:hypothetical protein